MEPVTDLKMSLRKNLKSAINERIRIWRAIFARWRSGATFIAVTGSSGKSTTTALISHILCGVAAVRTNSNSNKYRGIIKSLQTSSANSYYVGEIGTEGPGTLRPMLDLLRPSVGIVTLVALEHKSAFQNCEAVAEEKQELVEALPADGLAILNHDDARVAAMAERSKARTVTFGQTGGEYVVSNVRCPAPGELGLTITYQDQKFDITSHLTGVHQSVAVAAAFSCTHQLGIPPAVIVERIATFAPLFGRCSVYRVKNGPVFIVDTVKAPYHSLQLAFNMVADFSAPRKRIVIGQISDAAGADRVYRRAYQAARSVADQVIFVGEHSHRSKATAEEIAIQHFVEKRTVEEAARFLKETAIPGEVIVLKSSRQLHLERIMLNFDNEVRCWQQTCGKDSDCYFCGLYAIPFEQHKRHKNLAAKRHLRLTEQGDRTNVS